MNKTRPQKAAYRCHFGRTAKNTRGCIACPRQMPFILTAPFCRSCLLALPGPLRRAVQASFKRTPSRLAKALANRRYHKAKEFLSQLYRQDLQD